MLLKDKVALVTGSSRGFGAHISKAFAREGAQVIITHLDGDETEKENAATVASETRSELTLAVNVANRESVQAMFAAVSDKYGRLDVLVNNAGINRVNDFDKQTEEEWQEVLDVNLKGPFICTQEALKLMPDGGRVINIGSVSGQYGGPRTACYAVAKAGVMALTHNVARFVGSRNITVNCVSPGMIASEMLEKTMAPEMKKSLMEDVPLQRLGTMDEVAETLVFLASAGGGYISGQTIGVNGGLWVSGF
jgi:3-oxoacyl-[acyl-carrier protein] reductase